MGYCSICHDKFAPPGTRIHRGQLFGWNFQAWVVYQRIALRMSYRLISKATSDLFSEELSLQTAVGFVEKFAEYHQRTEDLLLRRIMEGPIVHLDETKINISGEDQYVWVFTDGDRVVFRLRPNREAEFLKPLFANFKGTVITDFYGGYDALVCRQQKGLVHLIRDLNDDLWKSPFDDELEGFVVAVRDLLVPIFADIQRFGLKTRHLRKHRDRVDRFYRQVITDKIYARDTTTRYRKRFERYRQSLFSFLENDGVPWHNNTAERALRHLAVQRRISGRSARKVPATTCVCSVSRKPAGFSGSRFSAFFFRKAEASTNTRNAPDCIRTRPPTLGKRNDHITGPTGMPLPLGSVCALDVPRRFS